MPVTPKPVVTDKLKINIRAVFWLQPSYQEFNSIQSSIVVVTKAF